LIYPFQSKTIDNDLKKNRMLLYMPEKRLTRRSAEAIFAQGIANSNAGMVSRDRRLDRASAMLGFPPPTSPENMVEIAKIRAQKIADEEEAIQRAFDLKNSRRSRVIDPDENIWLTSSSAFSNRPLLITDIENFCGSCDSYINVDRCSIFPDSTQLDIVQTGRCYSALVDGVYGIMTRDGFRPPKF
jgi:hypothetical protein